MQVVAVLDAEEPAARLDEPATHVVSQDDRVEQLGAGCTLSFGYRYRGVDEGRARVSADHMRSVDLVRVPGRAVRQCGERRGNAQRSSEYPGLRWTAGARGVTRRELSRWLTRAEVGTRHLVQDHLPGAFSHLSGNCLHRGGGRILRHCEGKRLGYDLPASSFVAACRRR